METIITAQEARKNFSDLLSKAAYAKEKVIVTRQGKNVAALISMEDYEFYRRLEDALDGRIAEERLKATGERFSLADVKKELGL